jgi:hypothetical protein
MLRVFAYFVPLLLVEIIAVSAYFLRFRESGGVFQYRITDMWAMTIGMTPTFLLAAHTARMADLGVKAIWPQEYLLVLLCVLGFSQILGAFVGRIFYHPSNPRRRLAWLGSGLCVAGGAICGFVAVVVYVLTLKFCGRPF